MQYVYSWPYVCFRLGFAFLDVCLSIYSIYMAANKWTYLHRNFRCLVCSTCASCLVVSSSLILFLVGQITEIHALIETPCATYFVGIYADAFATFFITIERGVATLQAKDYEGKKKNSLLNLLLFIFPFLCSGLFIWIYYCKIIPFADVISSVLFAIIALGCLVESLVIYLHNKKALQTRNENQLSLSAKFQYSENYSLSKTFLAVTANDLIVWVVLSILYYFASLLQDGATLLTSYDNWIMDLCDSIYLEKCFVFYVALYLSHRKYAKRCRRVRPEPLKITGHLHFGTLKDSWERSAEERRFSWRPSYRCD